MSGSGREALPDVREWLGVLKYVRACSGGPPRCLEVVGRPSRTSGRFVQMSGSGREVIPNVR